MSGDDIFAPLRLRLAQGETVDAADVAALVAADVDSTLAGLLAEAEGNKAEILAEVARKERVAELLVSHEAEADRVTDRLDAADRAFTAAVAELHAAVEDLSAVVRLHREALHRNGWKVTDAQHVMVKSGYRVIADRGLISDKKVKVPDVGGYVGWVRCMQAERDARHLATETMPSETPDDSATLSRLR